jgi:hypothetical protein
VTPYIFSRCASLKITSLADELECHVLPWTAWRPLVLISLDCFKLTAPAFLNQVPCPVSTHDISGTRNCSSCSDNVVNRRENSEKLEFSMLIGLVGNPRRLLALKSTMLLQKSQQKYTGNWNEQNKWKKMLKYDQQFRNYWHKGSVEN